jgi:site-specific recombinase XerD
LLNGSGSFADASARFIAWKLDRGVFTTATADKAKWPLADFAKIRGNTPVASVRPEHIRKWYEGLRKRVTESTAQGYVLVLRSFFRWTVEHERTRADNPVLRVELARAPKPARSAFCGRQLRDRLIAQAPDDDIRFILFAGFYAGLRRIEISEAKVGWFDMQPRLLHVRQSED